MFPKIVGKSGKSGKRVWKKKRKPGTPGMPGIKSCDICDEPTSLGVSVQAANRSNGRTGPLKLSPEATN